MEGNELMVGDDPTTIQARHFARLVDKCEDPSLRETAKWSKDPCQNLPPATNATWMSGITAGIFERHEVIQHGVLQ